MQNNIKKNSLYSVYFLGFLFAVHTALTSYLNSSFLSQYIKENYVGLIYVVASFLTILFFVVMPKFLSRFGNYKVTLYLVVFDMVSLISLAFLSNAIYLLLFSVINLICISLLYFSTDIFLEGYSHNKETGSIRGVYLTAVNLAWVFSPYISGVILQDTNNYWRAYFAAFIITIPILLILILSLRKFNDTKYIKPNTWQAIKGVWRNKDLFNIFLADFILYFFYSWMVVYTPIYLNNYIGFSWNQIGIIFIIMLLPFVLLQIPLGRLADTRFGEKEILGLGFFIMSMSTILISFIHQKSFLVWMIVLFMTRVGASMVEVMCDTYFFKKVDGLEAYDIGFYRTLGSWAYIFSLLLSGILLNVFQLNIKYLFVILGIIVFFGLKASLSIKDTK